MKHGSIIHMEIKYCITNSHKYITSTRAKFQCPSNLALCGPVFIPCTSQYEMC